LAEENQPTNQQWMDFRLLLLCFAPRNIISKDAV
jgi:hypothetical protein